MLQSDLSKLVFKQCALCASTSELQASHIIPGFVFDWLRDTSATGHFRSSQIPDLRVQDGLKPRMLCKSCEQLFSTWEKAFAEKCFVPLNSGNVRDVRYGPWMLKFATSVSWRVLRLFAANDGLAGFPRSHHDRGRRYSSRMVPIPSGRQAPSWATRAAHVRGRRSRTRVGCQYASQYQSLSRSRNRCLCSSYSRLTNNLRENGEIRPVRFYCNGTSASLERHQVARSARTVRST